MPLSRTSRRSLAPTASLLAALSAWSFPGLARAEPSPAPALPAPAPPAQASPAQASPATAAPAVWLVGAEGAVSPVALDELRIHLKKRLPRATIDERPRALDALSGAGAQGPEAVVLLGAEAAERAAGAPGGARGVVVGVGEHRAATLEGAGSLSGVVEGCPLESLARLVKRLSPRATRVGWVVPHGYTPPPGALASLGAALDEQGLSLERLDAGARDGAALGALAGRVDAAVMLAGPGDEAEARAIASSLASKKKPLFGCGAAMVERGATAALAVDPQQEGEAAGALVADLLEGRAKPGAWVVAEAGLIAVNLRSACEAGVVVPDAITSRAVVSEKGWVCPPAPGESRPRPWVVGGLGAAVAALLGAALGGALSPARRLRG